MRYVSGIARCSYLMLLVGYLLRVPANAQQPIAQQPIPKAVGCSTGAWTPGPLQRAQNTNPDAPTFHTVWGLSCGQNVYMIRFSNRVGTPPQQIVADVIGLLWMGEKTEGAGVEKEKLTHG